MTDTSTERGAESIWTRLRRRKVVQWGLVYVAAAWGFLQGLEYVSESFDWPSRCGRSSTARTPHRAADRARPRLVPRRPRPAACQHPELAILTLLLLLGGGGFWYYQRTSETAHGCDATVTAPLSPPRPTARSPCCPS